MLAGIVGTQRFLTRSAAEAAERVTLSPASPWWGEHRSRYHFAAHWTIGCSVLDVACGTGYGSTILREAGASVVVGVDAAWDALAQAPLQERSPFLQADATRLPFQEGSFDVVVSFETLEHIRHDVVFMQETKRVLRHDGLLVLSTPNGMHQRSQDGKPANPFHVREYTPENLQILLGRHFDSVTVLGQKTHPRFVVSPFWDPPSTLPRDMKGRLRVLLWKLQARLPFAVKDRMARLLYNRAFYPGEYDFVFDEKYVSTSHVLVALARSNRA